MVYEKKDGGSKRTFEKEQRLWDQPAGRSGEEESARGIRKADGVHQYCRENHHTQ